MLEAIRNDLLIDARHGAYKWFEVRCHQLAEILTDALSLTVEVPPENMDVGCRFLLHSHNSTSLSM